MIDVFICKEKGRYSGFWISGHACYAEKGKDIVCAAVSALEDAVKCTLEKMNIEMSEVWTAGQQKYYFTECCQYVDVVMNVFETGVRRIQEAYPQNVKVHLLI